MSTLFSIRRGAVMAVTLVAALGGVLAFPTQAATPVATPTTGPTVSTMDPNSGPLVGGTQVSIEGSGFTGATSVTFGTQTPAASFTVKSDQRIIAVSPPHAAGRVVVFVTTPDGTSSAQDGFGTPVDFVFSPYSVAASQPHTQLVRYQLGTGSGNKITMTVARAGHTRIVDTEKPATYRFILSAQKMSKLRALIAAAHVSTLDARYPRPDADIACGTDTQILTARDHKVVVAYAGEPPARAEHLLGKLLTILDNRDPSPFAANDVAAKPRLRC